jgi:hypothetical protein
MDNSPEGIREALAWLYGVEFRSGEVQYCATDSSVHVWFRESDSRWLLDHDHWDEDITAEVAHALEVTAPWEWVEKATTFECRCDKFDSSVWPSAYGDGVGWKWQVAMIPDRHEIVSYMADPCPDMAAAQSAARTAYLTWMRGRLALRGL